MKRYIQHQAPVLPVKDIKQTLEYYRDVFRVGQGEKNTGEIGSFSHSLS